MSSRGAALIDLHLDAVIAEWEAGLRLRQPGHDVSDEPRDESGKWTAGGGDGDGGDKESEAEARFRAEGEKMMLVSFRPRQGRIDEWEKQLAAREKELEDAGQLGNEESDEISRMQTALNAYGQTSDADLDRGTHRLEVVYNGNNKLRAAAFADINDKGEAKIHYLGGTDAEARAKVIDRTLEGFGKTTSRIEAREFNDRTDNIAQFEKAGFKIDRVEGPITILVKEDVKAPPDFGKYPIDIIMPKGLGLRFRGDVAASLDAIPPQVMTMLANARVTLHSGRKVTDVLPELHGMQPRGWSAGGTWDQAEGLFDPVTQQIIITEHYQNKDGELRKSERIPGVVLHESGHAFDFANGTPSTNSSSFREAYTEDHKNIPVEDRRKSRLSYFTPEGQAHGEPTVESGRAARSEAFAEIFAHVIGKQGSSFEDLTKDFPRVTAMMKQAIKDGRMSLK